MDDGWILCEEDMPEERDSFLTKYKMTDKWTDAMFEKLSDTVQITVESDKG